MVSTRSSTSEDYASYVSVSGGDRSLSHHFRAEGTADVTDEEYLDCLSQNFNAIMDRPGVDFWQGSNFGDIPSLPHPCIPDTMERETAWDLMKKSGYMYAFLQQAGGAHTEPLYTPDFSIEAMSLEPLYDVLPGALEGFR